MASNEHRLVSNRFIKILLYFIILITSIYSSKFGFAQKSNERSYAEEDCLECHSDTDIESERGTSVYVDTKLISGSIHGEFECRECHRAIGEHPDGEGIPNVDCGWSAIE